jgi:hypothetical protein
MTLFPKTVNSRKSGQSLFLLFFLSGKIAQLLKMGKRSYQMPFLWGVGLWLIVIWI